jgi:hypothetical protein
MFSARTPTPERKSSEARARTSFSVDELNRKTQQKGHMTSVEGYSLALPSTEETASELDLAALVETYPALLFRVAHSVLRSRHEAEHVVQDASSFAVRVATSFGRAIISSRSRFASISCFCNIVLLQAHSISPKLRTGKLRPSGPDLESPFRRVG